MQCHDFEGNSVTKTNIKPLFVSNKHKHILNGKLIFVQLTIFLSFFLFKVTYPLFTNTFKPEYLDEYMDKVRDASNVTNFGCFYKVGNTFHYIHSTIGLTVKVKCYWLLLKISLSVINSELFNFY